VTTAPTATGSPWVAALGGTSASAISSVLAASASTDPAGLSPVAIPIGGDTTSGLSSGFQEGGFGSALARPAGSGPGLTADPDLQSTPVICPQLAFQPLIAGCESLLRPVSGGGLASTGLSIIFGLTGLLAIVTGWLLYRRPGVAAIASRAITSFGIGLLPAHRIALPAVGRRRR
jgi:hypothetical protein